MALAAREKSAVKRLSSARGAANADGDAAIEAATPTKRPRASSPVAALALEDGSDEDGGPAEAMGSQGKRLRLRALLNDSEEEAPVQLHRRERSRSLAPKRPAESADAAKALREQCTRLQEELDTTRKAQEDKVSILIC